LVGGFGKKNTAARRWNDRLTFYEKSLREQPKSVRLYILLGEELRRQGKLDRAAAVMADARQVEPTYGPAWLLAGRIEIERGNWSAAEQFLNQAEKFMPNPMAVMSAREELEERKNRKQPQ
jgi:tetratricopeptide (TPR) repeat protein